MAAKTKISDAGKPMRVAPVEMNIGPYQRPLNEKRAKYIADTFKWGYMQPLTLSIRSNGTFWVVDGQHRHAALVYLGFKDEKVNCDVRTGLTVPQEAELFRALNNLRKPPTAFADFHAGRHQKDPAVLAIDKIVESHGLRISNSYDPRTIRSVRGVMVAFEYGVLDSVCDALARWSDGDDKTYMNNRVLQYLTQFFIVFPQANPTTLVRKLEMKSIGPGGLIKRAQNMSKGSDGQKKEICATAVLRQAYNYRNNKDRLPKLIDKEDE